MRWHTVAVLLAALCSACQALHPDVLVLLCNMLFYNQLPEQACRLLWMSAGVCLLLSIQSAQLLDSRQCSTDGIALNSVICAKCVSMRIMRTGMLLQSSLREVFHTALEDVQQSGCRGAAALGPADAAAAGISATLQSQYPWFEQLIGVSHALQSSISETPKQRRRRRLAAQPAIQTDPGADGIAIGLDGNVYSDTAITAAVAQVGQLGPLNPKVAVCHFPASDRSQYTVSS